MEFISGKSVAERILGEARAAIAQSGKTPGLAAILIGEYIESHKYIGLKEARAKETGIRFEKYLFPKTVAQETVFETIQELNRRPDIHGILVQLPLPEGWPTDEIILALDPTKDVDGFHPVTLERFLAGDETLIPVLPQAVRALLTETGVVLQGKRGVAVVNSVLLGKVLVQLFRLEGMSGEYVLSESEHMAIAEKTRVADVVVTACGIPDLITGSMLREGVIVIDAGNVHVKERVQGDVDREGVSAKTGFLSPVPGGVGPVTIACLLRRVTKFASTPLR